MNNLSILHTIHANNHTQVNRSCIINTNHSDSTEIQLPALLSNGSSFTNLSPGLYSIEINGDICYFDLYIAIGPNDFLIIRNSNYAYAYVSTKRYPIILYKKISEINNSNAVINNTVNSKIDMIVLDGYSYINEFDESNIKDKYAIIPKNKIIPSYQNQESWVGTLSDLQVDNIIMNNLTFKNSSKIRDILDAQVTKVDVRSIARFRLLTTSDSNNLLGKDMLDIYLKNNIKSLPNGTSDTFILNSELQQNHIIYRIGRLLFTGNEEWQYISDASNTDTCLFKLNYENVIVQDSDTNILSTHLESNNCTDLINSSCTDNGISTSSTDSAFYLRINKYALTGSDSYVSSLRRWFYTQLNNKSPFVLEYALANYSYKTILIDEYHINTYFPITYVKTDRNYVVSYFYKQLPT